jgi:ribosomal protein S27E
MALHCPECGFLNSEAANYCQRCGASLARAEGSSEPATATNHCQRCGSSLARPEGSSAEPVTATYRIDDETGELIPVELGQVTAQGPALVVRTGGGRAGESFAVQGERMSIGRRLESEVFLDDVTVSRDHAMLIKRGEQWHIDDCGSLNGTYVNRSRIDSHQLQDGDELQIGKYKLTFHLR